MGNKFGNAYGLTVLIPIKHGTENNRAYDKIIRDQLQAWPLDTDSPMAKVPNTYLSRVFLLNDVFYEGAPAIEEHLNNKYLVFSSNFYGELDTYLTGMWNAIGDTLKNFLRHCVAFDTVESAPDFVRYIRRCQIKTSLFFNGSSDTSYNAFDLDGFSTNASGYFLLGNPDVVPTPDIIFPGNGLQNGADAVALFVGDDTDFPSATPVT